MSVSVSPVPRVEANFSEAELLPDEEWRLCQVRDFSPSVADVNGGAVASCGQRRRERRRHRCTLFHRRTLFPYVDPAHYRFWGGVYVGTGNRAKLILKPGKLVKITGHAAAVPLCQ